MRRAVVFANGEMPDPAPIRALLRPDDWIVAADGGTLHALACDRTPDLVVGDLDSLPPGLRSTLEAQGTRFAVHPADKNETDLELALLQLAASQVSAVLVVGALGGRLDQMLTNIQLLSRPELSHLNLQIVDGRQTAHLVRHSASIHGAAGDRVSLIPLGGDVEGVHTQGLAWPLQDETLHFGQGRGVSNEMTGPDARVQVRTGLLLCVHSSRETS